MTTIARARLCVSWLIPVVLLALTIPPAWPQDDSELTLAEPLEPAVSERVGKTVWAWIGAFAAGDGDALAGLWYDPDGRITPAVAGALAETLDVNAWALGEFRTDPDGVLHVPLTWVVTFDRAALATRLAAAGVTAGDVPGLAAELAASVGEVWQLRVAFTEVNGQYKVFGLPQGVAAGGGAASPAEAARRLLAAAKAGDGEAFMAMIQPEDRATVEDRLEEWQTITIESFEIGDVTTGPHTAWVSYSWAVSVDAEAMANVSIEQFRAMVADVQAGNPEMAERMAAGMEARVGHYRARAARMKAGLEGSATQRMGLRRIGDRWFVDHRWFRVPN